MQQGILGSQCQCTIRSCKGPWQRAQWILQDFLRTHFSVLSNDHHLSKLTLPISPDYNMWWLLLFMFQFVVCLFVSAYNIFSGGRLHEVWVSRPPELLNTFSNLFIVVLQYTYHHMPCHVAIIDCTHVHHVVHYTKISAYHTVLLLLTVLMWDQLQPLSLTWYMTVVEFYRLNNRYFCRWSAIATFVTFVLDSNRWLLMNNSY